MSRFYGPCDPKYGSWFDAPEWVVRTYAQRIAALQADETRMVITAQINAALATNGRNMSDEDRNRFLRDLNSAPKAGPGPVDDRSRQMAQDMGAFLPSARSDAPPDEPRGPQKLASFLQDAHIKVVGGGDING